MKFVDASMIKKKQFKIKKSQYFCPKFAKKSMRMLIMKLKGHKPKIIFTLILYLNLLYMPIST